MIKHLPECWAKSESDPEAWCICVELCACEDRVARAFQVVRKDDTRKWEEFSLDRGLWIGWTIGTLMLLIPIIVLAVSND